MRTHSSHFAVNVYGVDAFYFNAEYFFYREFDFGLVCGLGNFEGVLLVRDARITLFGKDRSYDNVMCSHYIS